MTHADDLKRADAAFTALVQQADQEVDAINAVALDVETMLAGLKRRAADNHNHATQTVQQEQKDLQLVGATLTHAFSAPVRHIPSTSAASSPAERWDDTEWEEMAAAAMLRPDDGVRTVHFEGYAESSWDLSVLATHAVAGDRAAVSLLLGYIRPLIVRYCRARIGRTEQFATADDVAQEACLAVLTGLPGYREQGRPFLAFVYGIAAHKVASWRQTTDSRTINGTDQGGHPSTNVAVPMSPNREMAEQMAELLQVLPPKQREILVLRVVVGLSAEETADAIGSTPGTVRVAQSRALSRLRKEMARLNLL